MSSAEIRIATILFADIRNSAQISNVLNLHRYDGFISQFQGAMRRVLDEHLAEHYSPEEREEIDYGVRGDEACLIIYRARTPEDAERDVENAFHIAQHMKRDWLFTKFNRERLLEGKMIEDIGVGINMGEVVVSEHPGRPGERSPEGWAINFAKKVEGTSREAPYSKIMVSQSVHHIAKKPSMGVSFAERQIILFSGIDRRLPVYEVKCFDLGGEQPESMTPEERRVMERALRNNPYDLWLSLMYGNALYHEGDFDKAIDAFRNAIDAEPDYVVPYFNIGTSYYRQGLVSSAAEYVDLALSRDPGYAKAHYLRALILGDRGDYEAEIAAYEVALDHDPTYVDATINLCEVMLLHGRPSEALNRIEQGLRALEDAEARLILGFLGALSASVAEEAPRRQEFLRLTQEGTTKFPKGHSIRFDFTDCMAMVEEKLSGEWAVQMRALSEQIARLGNA